MKATISAKYLPMLARFAAKNDVRYYLNGMLIERAPCGGAYLVATNGHCILIVHDKLAVVDDEKMIVPLPKLFISQVKTAGPRATAHFDGERASLFAQEIPDWMKRLHRTGARPVFTPPEPPPPAFVLEVAAKAIDGKYPDWRAVIPANETAIRHGANCVDHRYLKLVCDPPPGDPEDSSDKWLGAPILRVDGGAGLEFGGKVVVRFDRMPQLLSIIMGMRSTTILPARPEWLDAP